MEKKKEIHTGPGRAHRAPHRTGFWKWERGYRAHFSMIFHAVYARHVDSSSLGSSLSSHRQSYIGLVFSSHIIDLIMNIFHQCEDCRTEVSFNPEISTSREEVRPSRLRWPRVYIHSVLGVYVSVIYIYKHRFLFLFLKMGPRGGFDWFLSFNEYCLNVCTTDYNLRADLRVLSEWFRQIITEVILL